MAIYDPTKRPVDAYDTHTHLNEDIFWGDPAAYWARAREYRIMEMNVVGFDAKGNTRAIELADQFEGIKAIVGFQPEDVEQLTTEQVKILEAQLAKPEVVGVGETGLDYYWDKNPDAAVQKQAFQTQLALAKNMHKPVTVHVRDAFDDVYTELKESDVQEFGGVMHSFTGNVEEVKRFLDLGLYISFSGIATFNNADDIREAAKQTPLDRILVETDAPYLAPVPMRGKPNEPMYVHHTIASLAETLGMEYNDLAKVTTENAHRLWKIPHAN